MLCLHCQNNLEIGQKDFCCNGCKMAYGIINKLGFHSYYNLRQIDPKERKIKPEVEDKIDVSEFIHEENNIYELSLMVQGLHCAACVWLIENILQKQKDVIFARINLSKKTLLLKWQNDRKLGNELVSLIADIGYKLLPFDAEILALEEKKYDDKILRCLAVAGFGAGNIMLFSVSLWFADALDMREATRNLFHFFSSLIALPVIIYSSRPFFTSAYKSVKARVPNMDLAIAIAIFLASVVSLFESFRSAKHVYFDSAVMLTFFLLIGRYLDLKARKKAFSITTEFTLLASSFGRILEDGKIKVLATKDLREGMILLVAVGEKIAADGIIVDGISEIDFSLVSGESLPKRAAVGAEVYAGTINLSAPLKIRITKNSQNSLLSQIIALSSEVENKKNKYIRIADRLSKFYLPAVHILALLTFLYWFGSGWENALMNATAVLIVTCPCALALAIPIVQTIVISNFIKRGVLIKSGEAVEKLCEVTNFVFDKTGSLTLGNVRLCGMEMSVASELRTLSRSNEEKYLKLAASLACKSSHPLSQAITKAYKGKLEELSVQEIQGQGLVSEFAGKVIKLGRKEFVMLRQAQHDKLEEVMLRLSKHGGNQLSCYMSFGDEQIIFYFEDEIKSDAKAVIARLQDLKKNVILLSGDNEEIVKNVAHELGITEFYAKQTPIEKTKFLEKLKLQKKEFVMVGDGLNDAPSLALADVSISFSRASDISQNIADIVIQGEKLTPIIDLLIQTKKAISLMKENLIIALIYNLFAVPFAMIGFISPLFAAIAMSSSSLLVLFNSLRINKCQS